ncbi:alpha-2-macroglobulin [Parabacteroides sp. ZJ-118]|uniref:alpha-2-macroglobulin family protein n=1 Tax=Parabacteroides sp. ZJ-118 TaxID=2709398 RepID=UPI0013ED09E4|nr:alpha-2-macroglobulin family protein [Parabacteroides sp. ZJ-118]
MKMRAIVLSALILCGISAVIMYSRAARPQQRSSVITQAINEKNTPMVIKNLILKMKEQMEINDDRFPELIRDVENYTNSRADSASVAVLHSMLAEMYQHYYQRNQWTIDRRTQLSGYIPEDMREWTSNLFTDKIKEEIDLSLRPAALLQNTPVSRFKDILETGKDSQTLRPTLYEFLAFRALDIQPTVQIYKDLIAFQNKEPNMKAVLLTELDYLRFLYGDKRDKASFEAYRNALDELYRSLASQDYAAEILIAQLDLISGSMFRQVSTQWDSIKAEEVKLCEEGIKRYSGYPRTAILKNRLAQLEQPTLSVSTDNTVYPGQQLAIKLEYKNVRKALVQIYRSSKTPLQAAAHTSARKPSSNTLGQLVHEKTFSLLLPDTYSRQDTTLHIAMDQPGLYECVVTVPGQQLKTTHTVSVTRLAAIHRNLPGNKQEVMVTDYLSGKPIDGAVVTYYGGQRRSLQERGSVKTDREGLATLPADRQVLAFQASRPGDTNALLTTIYPTGSGHRPEKSPVEVSVFTDRGLYRPGQTLFFKGLAYVKDSNDPHAVAGQPFTVTLHDANGKEIARKKVTTNDFGSFNGEFSLPKQTLSGVFRLSTGQMSVYVNVEEYKRPTFQAHFLPIKGDIAFGDSVTIQGEAATFSGVSLPGGDVAWRITRRPFLSWRYFRSSAPTQVAEGSTTLSGDGTFSVSFRPQKEENTDPYASAYQTYEVSATVTDSKGESQEANYTFSVGESSIVLFTNLPTQVEKDSVKAVVEARTINGEMISTSGTFKIVEQIANRSDKNSGEGYREGKQVASGNFTSGKEISPAIFNALSSGRYRILVDAKDSQGRQSKNQSDFILYGKSDKRPPVFTHTWLLKEKTTCLPGEDAEIVFGTSDKDAYVLYEWFAGNNRIHHEVIRLSDANRRFKIPFKPEYGDGITVSFTFVKAGELYITQVPVALQLPDRQLTIKPITFRDRLLPGSKENWKFRITDADSAIVSAEVLAGMYDASLDKIIPFNWYFSPRRTILLQAPRFSTGTGFQRSYQYDQTEARYIKVPQYQYDRLNWFGLFNTMRGRRYGQSSMAGGILMKSAMATQANMAVEVAEDRAIAEGSTLEEETVESTETLFSRSDLFAKGSSLPISPEQIRQNFAETAFFYPTLQTNEAGDLFVNFTLPESNTTWKLQLLANTQDLKYGLLTKEIISSKPLMVLPNLPRFVRQGDAVSISTQVINNSKEAVSGRIRIELFDPDTDQPIICLSKSQRPFELQPDSIAAVSWLIPVPQQISLLGVRILADSEKGSDGEQQIVPVLSNQLLITESTPFYLIQEGEKSFRISGNSEGKTPFRLTLEMTGNPIWYAVQALPTITQPNNDNILSWFAAYYSNTLASYIAQAHPRIREVISQWTAQGGNASTLYSNLEKNQALKNILLEETPWVLAADNETEQKQRLSLLFDLSRADGLREAALRQLIQQQNEEGGWSWFKGFPASRAITLSILKGMSQLVQLNAIQYGQTEKEMQLKAIKFLDKCMQADYESLRKHDKKWQNRGPSPEQVEFLFVRSSYRDIPELGDAREAIRFYTNQAEKHWNQYALINKGEIALLMHRNGKKEVSTAILTWLKKTATISEEKGMYWANNRRGNDYFTSPVDTHCLLMSVFNEIAPDTRNTNRMKQWLLNRKRTQDWESVPATVNAIYALLLTGSDWLNTRNTCVATWDGKTYSTAEGEIATGYLKTILPDEPAHRSANPVLSIRKEGNTPAWGAVYEQYFQDIHKVKGQKGVLNVEKKLFVETHNGTNRQIRPVTPEQPLRIGDKVIVRLTIRTDREMDYVFLKDLRAGCFEPADQLSGTESRDGIWYYRSPKDVSENFFINRLPEGTFVLEYPVYVSRSGEYAGGISTIQCMYAPEFVSHTAGESLQVEP